MMLSGRPLLATAADRRYLVDRPEADLVLGHVRADMNTLVLAERGMGKTTLLRHLEGRLEDEVGIGAVYLDGHRLNDSAMILLAVRDRLAGPRTPIGESLRAAAMPFTPIPVETRNEEALRLVRGLATEAEKRQVCVLLDDPDPDVAHQLFGRLRDELWQTGLVWVVAGDQARRQQYLTPPSDAFFERTVELTPLTDEQQRDLIRRRLDRHDSRELLGVRIESGNPRALLTALRDAAGSAEDVHAVLARRGARQQRAHEELGRLEELMLAEIEDGAAASASDPDWLQRFGVSRQRAQQALAALESHQLVHAERLPGPSGRPRKVYRRVESS
jgi:energy-coupling factor transporter ATP-binding protein EcfA2